MMRPPRRQFSPTLRIAALILCTTFSLTQAAPAWAMRAEGVASPAVKAGLEEAFRRDPFAGAGVAPDLTRLNSAAALQYLAYQTSRQVPAWREQFYNRFSSWQGESDCRVCAMRGNVLQGIPQMLRLMLTGGYDGAGISIKAKIKGKYFLITVKDAGHLNALLKGMFEEIDLRLRESVAREYGVDVNQVSPLNPELDESFELDPEFGDLVFRMQVGGEVVSIPMEAIGHTRWATVGRPAGVNSHPHHKTIPGLFLPDGRPLEVTLAHNGNFHTYELFRSIVLELGATIDGQTDSEVLALVLGFMHRVQPGGLVPLNQAIERTLRLVKYVEDWRGVINLLQMQTPEAKKHHPAVVAFLRDELAVWGVRLPARLLEADLIRAAKDQIDQIIREGLQNPWLFDDAAAAGRQDLARSLSARISQDSKAQVGFRQRFFDQTYSSIAIAAMNNVEDGIAVARGRTGGALSVYVPPIFAVAERMRDQADRITAQLDPAAAKAEWLPRVRDVQQQVAGLVSMWQAGNLIFPEEVGRELSRLQRELDETYDRTNRLRPGANLGQERNRIIALFKAVMGFAQARNGTHDPGRRIAASEPRAIPGVPGSAREHPDARFRRAGRGQMDGYKLEMGHVALLGRTISRTSVWDSELKKPLSQELPKPEVVDLANVGRGAADSRLELEIGNMLVGARHTLEQFAQGGFPDLNYSDTELGDVEEWIFVGEGTSEHLARVAALAGESSPGRKIRMRVMTGKDFQTLVASGELRESAEALARNGRRIIVTFVSNTGQTETLLNGATQLNRLNQQLPDAQKVFPSVVTNVAGSAIDDEVSRFDGDRHAVYTLVGYEMAVPATGSLDVGVMAGGLLTAYVKSLTTESGGKVGFFDQLRKLNEFVEHLNQMLEPTDDKSLRVTPAYAQLVDDALGRMNVRDVMPLIWITGWWIWRIAAAEARLKFQEGFRDPAVTDWDVISGKHGPYGILRPGQTAVAFLPSATAFKEGHEITLQSLRELRSRIGYSEGGGRQGQLIVLMDARDFSTPEVYGKVSLVADVIVPIPDMDNALTGFIGVTVFMQLLTLYGARERFAPIREELMGLDRQIQESGLLSETVSVEGAPQPWTFHNSAEFLKVFSATLSDPRSVSQTDALRILTELELLDPAHFREFRMRAQQRGQSATEIALQVTDGVVNGEIGKSERSSAWTAIRQYAGQAYQILHNAQTRLANQRTALHAVMERRGVDPSALRRQYERLEDYSFAPSEAIRFAADEREWREYTETFVRHLSKQISGVEARLDAATRTLLREHGIPDRLLETTLRGLMRVEEGQVQAYPGVLELLSQVTGRSRGELTRAGLHHEAVEILLRMVTGADQSVRAALDREMAPDALAEFRRQFADEFQPVDDAQWPYEVAAQYYTAQFVGDQAKLQGLFGNGVRQAVEGAMKSAGFHETVAPQGSGTNDQISALRRVAGVVKTKTGMVLRLDIGSETIPEVEAARAALTAADVEIAAVGAGLEETPAGRQATLEGQIHRAVTAYGRIVSAQDPLSLPSVPSVGAVNQLGSLVAQGKHSDALLLVRRFHEQFLAVDARTDAHRSMVASLERLLKVMADRLNDLASSAVPVVALTGELQNRGRTPTQAAVFAGLLRQYLQRPGVYVSLEPVARRPTASSVSALFPYSETDQRQSLNVALSLRAQKYLDLLRRDSASASVTLADSFVTVFHGVPGGDVACISLEIADADLDRLKVDLRILPDATRAVVRLVEPYIRDKTLVEHSAMRQAGELDPVARLLEQFLGDGQHHIELIDVSANPTAGTEEPPADLGVPKTLVLIVGPYLKTGAIQSVAVVATSMLGLEVEGMEALPPRSSPQGLVGVLRFVVKGISRDNLAGLRVLNRTFEQLILENLKWGPGAQVVSLVPGQAVPTAVLNHSMVEATTRDAESLAVAVAQAGVIGLVPQAQADLAQTVADELDHTWAPAITPWLTQAPVHALIAQLGRRFLTRSTAVGPVLRLVDHIKGALTNNYWQTALAGHEAGSVAVAVAGPGVESLGDLGHLPSRKWMMMVATHIPADAQAEFAPGGATPLDPLMPVVRLISMLDRLLVVNGKTTAAGAADWGKLVIVQIDHVRERGYRAAFELLASRGVRLITPKDGTLSWGLRAIRPTAPDEPLIVEWTASKPDRAVANLLLTKAAPLGGWVSLSLLASAINGSGVAGTATGDLPVGGARDFSEPEREEVRAWRAAQGDAEALLADKFLTPADVQGEVAGVVVPITSTAAFGSPIDGETGIPGIQDLGDGVFGLTPIWVLDRQIFARRTLVEAEPLPAELRFTSRALANASASAGLEEAGDARAVTVAPAAALARPTAPFRNLVGDLKALAVAPAKVQAGVGAIAGPGLVDGVSGLAHGVVLRQQLGVPVVFLVASEVQRTQFVNTEFFDGDDVLVASGNAAADAERAARQLAAKYNVGVAGRVYLGVEGHPAAPSLEALLAQWGVDLTAYPANLLRYRIGKASEYFA